MEASGLWCIGLISIWFVSLWAWDRSNAWGSSRVLIWSDKRCDRFDWLGTLSELALYPTDSWATPEATPTWANRMGWKFLFVWLIGLNELDEISCSKACRWGKKKPIKLRTKQPRGSQKCGSKSLGQDQVAWLAHESLAQSITFEIQ